MIMRKGKRSHAFTLIELVIVIAIISLLVFASLPTFRDFITTSRLRQGAYDIISALRTARSSSVTERLKFATLFYNYQNLWSAVQVYCVEDTERGSVAPWKRLPEDIVVDTTILDVVNDTFYSPLSGSFPDQVARITFNYRGGAEESNLEVLLRDVSTGDTAQVKVLQSTGRIYLFSFQGKEIKE